MKRKIELQFRSRVLSDVCLWEIEKNALGSYEVPSQGSLPLQMHLS